MINETHCRSCSITFDSVEEIDYIELGQPCCPRCGSENLEIFRMNGKIVGLNNLVVHHKEYRQNCLMCKNPSVTFDIILNTFGTVIEAKKNICDKHKPKLLLDGIEFLKVHII